jgi:PQQ-like domain
VRGEKVLVYRPFLPSLACALALLCVAPAAGAVPGRADTGGDQLWVRRYDGPTHAHDFWPAVAVSPDGTRVYTTGDSANAGYYTDDWITAAYDATTGATVWARRDNDQSNGSEWGASLVVSPDGSRLFATGNIDSGHRTDYATIAFDAATGVPLWAKHYNGPGDSYDDARSIATSPDGTRVFVTGASAGSGTGFTDYATVAYDAGTGARVWARRYNGPGNGSDVAYSLAVSPDGTRVFLTGESEGSGTDFDYATVAYDAATGGRLWARRYNGPGNGADIAYSLAVSSDGTRVVVTGSSVGAGTAEDYATVAYDAATGGRLWARRYNGPGDGADIVYSLAFSSDGTLVVVTGSSVGSGTAEDYATVAYDAATGARLWARRYNGPGNGRDWAVSTGVSPDGGSVFVTGSSTGDGTDLDFATLAYDGATGTLLWESRYDGPATFDQVDVAGALAVSSDGTRVFVVGGSNGVSTLNDATTIAYEA